MILDDRGYVGFGTTDLTYPFQVNGGGLFSGTLWGSSAAWYLAKTAITGYLGILAGNNGSTGPSLKLYAEGYASGDFYKGNIDLTYGGDPAGTPGNLNSVVRVLYLDDAGVQNERLRMTSTGLLGIGQTNPTALLDLRTKGASSATSGLVVWNSAGTELMRLRDDGYVGIGTSNPTAKLEVVGTTKLNTSNFVITEMDTIYTPGGKPRWIRWTTGATEWFSMIFTAADTAGKW
jgi:hypothetical protein